MMNTDLDNNEAAGNANASLFANAITVARLYYYQSMGDDLGKIPHALLE
jgi:hypothetical protein